MGSPSSIIMLGLGNGTFNGSPSLLVTLGFGIGSGGLLIDPTTTISLPTRPRSSALPTRAHSIDLPSRPHSIGVSPR